MYHIFFNIFIQHRCRVIAGEQQNVIGMRVSKIFRVGDRKEEHADTIEVDLRVLCLLLQCKACRGRRRTELQDKIHKHNVRFFLNFTLTTEN